MVQYLFFPHRYKWCTSVVLFSNWRRHSVEARETLHSCAHWCFTVNIKVSLFVRCVSHWTSMCSNSWTVVRWLNRVMVLGTINVMLNIDGLLSSMMNRFIVIQYMLFWSNVALWKIDWWELWIGAVIKCVLSASPCRTYHSVPNFLREQMWSPQWWSEDLHEGCKQWWIVYSEYLRCMCRKYWLQAGQLSASLIWDGVIRNSHTCKLYNRGTPFFELEEAIVRLLHIYELWFILVHGSLNTA